MNVKDWKGLNWNEIEKNKKELEVYPEYLPLILSNHISSVNRRNYLTENNKNNIIQLKYDKRIEFKNSNDKTDWLINEMVDWLNKHKEYMFLVK